MFSCVVANRAGSVTSSGATLTVLPSVVIGTGTGLSAVYFDHQDLTGPAVLRTDPTIDFAWAGNASPVAGIAPGSYSVRWSGQVQAQITQTYVFSATADDGVRLWVGGRLLIDQWRDQAASESTGSIALSAGVKYDLVLEYYQAGGDTRIALAWSGPSTAKQIVPATQLYPATVADPWSAGRCWAAGRWPAAARYGRRRGGAHRRGRRHLRGTADGEAAPRPAAERAMAPSSRA